MTTITKTRNEIRFIREDGKYWYIDINDCAVYGFSGKTVRNLPTGGATLIKHYIDTTDNDTAVLLNLFKNRCINMVKFYEKVANVQELANAHYNIYRMESDENILRSNEYTEKQLLRALRVMIEEDAAEGVSTDWSVIRLANYIKKAERMAKFGSLVEQYGADVTFKAFETIKCYYPEESITKVQVERVIKWMRDETLTLLVETEVLSSYALVRVVEKMVKMCYRMGVKFPKGNLINEYALLRNNYSAWKNRAKEVALNEVQSKVTQFETDEFVALVPTTIEELVQEGNAQRNCLGGYWLRGYGNSSTHFERGVVLIRRKSNPEKPYITCDFSAHTGQIYQFLGKNNSCVTDKDARDFRVLLQAHLFNCFAN